MRPFSLLVKPASADCNLDCSYCFYKDKTALYPDTPRHRMWNETLEAMIRRFFEAEQPEYAFAWQGGEPTLMGQEFFERAVELQARYAPAGSRVTNGLQTNGTLIDDAFAAFLAKNEFLVGISIDGPAAVHDRYRVTRDGRGSHDGVLRGLEALRRHGVDFNVLALVTQANVADPSGLYTYLKEIGARYHQYIPCVEFEPDGEPAPYSIGGREWGRFLTGLFDAWAQSDTETVSIRLFDSVLQKLLTGRANVCHMGKDCRHYFVVEHSGDVYPCDFYVEAERRLGNVHTDRFTELWRSPAYRRFGREKKNWGATCDACPYLQLCAGDCPKMRTGDASHPSVLCEGWKQFYAHSLHRFEELADAFRAGTLRRA